MNCVSGGGHGPTRRALGGVVTDVPVVVVGYCTLRPRHKEAADPAGVSLLVFECDHGVLGLFFKTAEILAIAIEQIVHGVVAGVCRRDFDH